MKRKAINVLVLPYFINDENDIEYAIFKRSDLNCWQGIAGGVEEEESILEAAKRESFEEAKINGDFIKLDTKSSIPIKCFEGDFDDNLYIVTEYSFGLKVENKEISLSSEHKEYNWLSYYEAMKLLKFDSNRTALWELNERLLKNKEKKK